MKPFRAPLWITKFVAPLTLMLMVIPAALYIGG